VVGDGGKGEKRGGERDKKGTENGGKGEEHLLPSMFCSLP